MSIPWQFILMGVGLVFIVAAVALFIMRQVVQPGYPLTGPDRQGIDYTPVDPADLIPPPQQPGPATAVEKYFCTACGTLFPDGAAFCPKCGTKR